MTLTVRMFPAREGDCLLLEYADEALTRRILVDGGRAATWPALKDYLASLPDRERRLELLVITHVDRDHIEGVLAMLADHDCPVTFDDIWFNGYGHLKAVDEEDFGAVQGEYLSELLLNGHSWNRHFGRRSVRLPLHGKPVAITLNGGLTLTLLSPGAEALVRLRDHWETECKKAHLLPSPALPEPQPADEPFGGLDVEALAEREFDEDAAPANGSSIALLVDYAGRRVLLGADAHPSILLDALERLFPGERVALDAFKVPHHGSRANLTRELLAKLECPMYLVSTNGSYFRHPSREAIARILKWGGKTKAVAFNYATEFTTIWNQPNVLDEYSCRLVFGEEGHLEIAL